LIAGREVTRAAAIAAIAERLRASVNPLIAGLATDIAGAEAAHDLAQQIGAVLDHRRSPAALADLAVMRESGWLVTTPLEARAMADCVVLVGATPPDFPRSPPPFAPERARQVFRLAGDDLLLRLGLLRATLAGRPIAADANLTAIAAALRAARYAVISWSAAEIAPLAIEMLCQTIEDLNGTTRCFGLPTPAPDNAAGVLQALAWKSGFPFRLGYARGRAEHDPWRFDGARMIEAREADCVLWVGDEAPRVPAGMFLAVLAPAGGDAGNAEIVISVATPGRDADTILFDPAIGALRFQPATDSRNTLPTSADILTAIAAQANREAVSC
jgi:formylmethanofuran dehydrogenase subunit B